jgi:hypothetical protein
MRNQAHLTAVAQLEVQVPRAVATGELIVGPHAPTMVTAVDILTIAVLCLGRKKATIDSSGALATVPLLNSTVEFTANLLPNRLRNCILDDCIGAAHWWFEVEQYG